jgi:hypothetical protein
MPEQIKITFRSCDGGRWSKRFKSRKGAIKAITHQLGDNPEIGCGGAYAVSFDGIVTCRSEGVTLRELFPAA